VNKIIPDGMMGSKMNKEIYDFRESDKKWKNSNSEKYEGPLEIDQIRIKKVTFQSWRKILYSKKDDNHCISTQAFLKL